MVVDWLGRRAVPCLAAHGLLPVLLGREHYRLVRHLCDIGAHELIQNRALEAGCPPSA